MRDVWGLRMFVKSGNVVKIVTYTFGKVSPAWSITRALASGPDALLGHLSDWNKSGLCLTRDA